ncbi:hypothetical protein QTP88_024920 [Uroleucon formosanum]
MTPILMVNDVSGTSTISPTLIGQTYDNAMNMSGQYSGLQARIKEINPLADFIPCSAHSLNLIGTCAASCCKNAFKELSTTRWSTREDAYRSLNYNWDRVISTLKEIKNNNKQKAQTRCEAKVVELYESLIQYISNLRNEKMFKMYEDRASKLHGGNKEYKLDVQRKRKRKIFYEESQDELNCSGRKHFLINTYYVILDKIHTELFKRKESYDKLTLKYSFLFNLTTISESEVFKCAENLCKIYKDDLDKSFCNECVHFQSHIKSLKDKAPKNIRDLSTLIRSKDLQAIYPYVDIALRNIHQQRIVLLKDLFQP